MNGSMNGLKVYIASSFRHLHAVRLLGLAMRAMGYELLDWTEKATPPEGLNAAERRAWMDTDHGGDVFVFCERACREADFVIYLGASGQDAGVEVGLARGSGVPVLGVRGPLESPGLMLYGAADVWVENVEDALALLQQTVHDARLLSSSHAASMSNNVAALLRKYQEHYHAPS